MCLAAIIATSPAASQEVQRVVRALEFAGNRALDDEVLGSVIATTNSSWWARLPLVGRILGEKRYFDEVEFRRDVIRLIVVYRASGYMSAVVDTLVRRTPRDVFVTFRIHEGEPVRVTKLDILGVDRLLDVAATKRDLPLQLGDPFNRFLLLASADTVAARLKNRGYPYAEVLRNFDSDAGRRQAGVTLEVLPGPRMWIDDVAIQGVDKIDTSTVRRMLTVTPGALYRQRDLFQSQRDLYGMDVFRSVSVLLVDSLPLVDRTDTTVVVLVRVVEGAQHRVRLGAGYGSLDCIRTQGSWSAHDFLGGARVLTLSARVSRLGVGSPSTWGLEQNVCRPLRDDLAQDSLLNYTGNVSLEQPAFLSPRHRASINVFAERRREIEVYTREAIGFNAGVTFNARREVPVTVSWGYSLGRTRAQPAVYCGVFQVCDRQDQAFLSQRRAFAAVTATAVRDRLNSPVDPTRGSIITATVVHASRVVGSDSTYEFNRAEVEIARYYPLGRYAVFVWRVRSGTILPQRITLSGPAVAFVPPDQRFYAGGPNSVRGYPRNELGPRVYVIENATGETVPAPTGGNSLFVFNAELRLPSPVWAQRMRLAAFVDVGRVWQRGRELFSVDSMRITPGLGVRFTTPLGPVRLDVAYNGYGKDAGPLYREEPNGDLTQIGTQPAAPPPGAFRRRLFVQFAVGQAF
jgi:outer membrane protein assembly factor BamA